MAQEQDKGAGIESEQIKAFVLHNIKRVVTNLFKGQLETTAELNQIYLSKLMKNKSKIPPDVYTELSWWDTGTMGNVRKKTLDKGNDAVREIESLFDKVEVKFKL